MNSGKHLAAVLAASLIAGCTAGDEGGSEQETEEDLNEAYAELLATEGKADGATCSGVRPPDSGPFGGKIALTFDDGPNLDKTPKVLEVLARHNAKATFFVNGMRISSEARRDLLRRLAEEGHLVANHSENHKDSRTLTAGTWTAEVRSTHDTLVEVLADLEITPAFFRFPYGSANCTTYSVVTGFGYHVVGWHIDTADWCFQSSSGGYGYCSSSTFQHIPDSYRDDFVGWSIHQAGQYNGGILLLHDVHTYTVDHLDELLTRLTEAGYTFTRLDDAETFPLLNGVTPPRQQWIGDPCEDHAECAFEHQGEQGVCFTFTDPVTDELEGFCTLSCDGYCPDQNGAAPTFCAPSFDPQQGMCVSQAWPINESCAAIPGTEPREEDRFVYQSSAAPATRLVCLPR